MSAPKKSGEIFAQVHAIVKRIPRGKVVTYGQLSELIDGRLSALAVGWALRAAKADTIPWQRVINAQGRLSTESEVPGLQRALLEAEGVVFKNDVADLTVYQWRPRQAPKSGRP
jgi:methylated-DNA-protein-cysteine methyltransferase related protein